jgi:hypothetical protein
MMMMMICHDSRYGVAGPRIYSLPRWSQEWFLEIAILIRSSLWVPPRRSRRTCSIGGSSVVIVQPKWLLQVLLNPGFSSSKELAFHFSFFGSVLWLSTASLDSWLVFRARSCSRTSLIWIRWIPRLPISSPCPKGSSTASFGWGCSEEHPVLSFHSGALHLVKAQGVIILENNVTMDWDKSRLLFLLENNVMDRESEEWRCEIKGGREGSLWSIEGKYSVHNST